MAMCIPRVSAIIVSATLAVAPSVGSSAESRRGSCALPAENVLRELSLTLRDRQRTEATLKLPANTPLMLVAGEREIDAILEIRDAGVTSAADNPLRRLGPQRILLGPGRAREIVLAGIGKEPARGTMKVSLVSLRGMPPQCVRALGAMAAGDAQYARGQSISMGDVEAGELDQPQAYAKALVSYREAAAAIPQAEALRANALMSTAGVLLLGLQDWPKALEASHIADAEAASLGDDYARLRAHNLWAVAVIELAYGAGSGVVDAAVRKRTADQFEQGRAALRELAESYARRGEIYDQAIALNNIGLSYYNADEFAAALPEYRVAQSLLHGLGERMREAQVVQNIALTQLELAQFAAARENFSRALTLIDATNSPKLYADILNNRGLLALRTGHFDDSLRDYSQALAILGRVQSTREQARSLFGIANVYSAIGNRREALAYHQRSFEKRSAKADVVGYLYSLNALAEGLRADGRAKEALAIRTDAMKQLKTDVQRARLLVALAADQLDIGALDAAAGSLAEVIDTEASGDRVVFARALAVRAKVGLARRQLAPARADVAAALSLFRKYQLTNDEFDLLLTSAKVACQAKDPAAASRDVDAALNLAEKLRRATNNPIMRASLWEPIHPAFDLRIQLLLAPRVCGAAPAPLEAGRARRALEIAERSRARALDEFRELAARNAAAVANPAVETRRQQLFEQIAYLRQRIEADAEGGKQDSARNETLRAEIVRLMRELDILDAGVKPLATKRPDPAIVIRQTIEMIPQDTAVIEYWLGETQAYAWFVSHGGIQAFDLGPSRPIKQAVQDLRDSMSNFLQVRPELRVANARKVHSFVVAPLAKALKGVRTVYFVPDGALHEVAFATLVTNSASDMPRYLVDDLDIAVGASVDSVLAALDRPKLGTDAPMLIVADPVYGRDDERFASRREPRAKPASPTVQVLRGGNTDELPRLAGSALEADVIGAMFGAKATERLEGFDANRDALLSRDLARYRVIHFAAHSIADIEAPQLSTVVLSTINSAGKEIPGEVFAGDLLGRKLNADLVVLSGCDTSLGKQFIGEGLLGMRYAAHAAGAQSVVASLWQVSDAVGPQLMGGFYSRMIRANQSPVAALSQAMREAKKKRSDPALWGVFQASQARRGTTIH